MFPDSDFAVPVGSFIAPVPRPLSDPDAGELVYIGVNCEWIPYIAGALQQLLLQSTWQYDTTDELNQVQGRAFNLISLFNCATAPNKAQLQTFRGMEVEESMPLRVDCNCNVYVTCCDGTEKQILTGDQVKALMNTQPAAGSEQPAAGGGCVQYHGVLQGGGKWILPAVVSSGDTIELLNANGATNDGTDLIWRCPNGEEFVAGGCVGFATTSGSDPLPSANHLAVIALIDGAYYDLSSGLLNVPGGVTNQQVILQVNDDVLSGNSGSIDFDIQVCNNQTATWTHVFDFRSNAFASLITALNDGCGNFRGAYASGTGYETNALFCAARYADQLNIELAFSGSLELTSIEIIGSVSGFSYTVSDGNSTFDFRDNAGHIFFSTVEPTAPAFPYSWSGDQVVTSPLKLQLWAGMSASAPPGALGVVQQIVLSGKGHDPFI